jgi:tRNA(Ile)-lysidine synthase
MGDELLNRVSTYVQRHDLIRKGDRVLAAVSGGADSVCLLSVLKGLQGVLSFELRAVHVDHGIRKESGLDREYVEDLCRKLDVPCSVYLENIPEKLEGSGMSEEELGRKIRYEDLKKTLKAWRTEEKISESDGKDPRYLIATAHHKNDQAETVLFRLLRGSGIAGLGGIRPKRDDIIRPLLFLERGKIEAYLQKQGLSFCEDVTNADCTYSRNKIRHELIPAAKEVSGDAVGHIAGAAEILQETWDFLGRMGTEAKKRCEIGEGILDRERFLKEDPYLQKQVLLLMIRDLPTGGKDIGTDHLDKMSELVNSESGGELDLPGECRFVSKQGRIRFEVLTLKAERCGTSKIPPILMAFCRERKVPLQIFGEDPEVYRFFEEEFEATEGEFAERVLEKGLKGQTQTQYFDSDALSANEPVCIRHRMPGDYMIINEAGNKKPLKEILIEEKVPEEHRDLLWFPAVGSEVLWIPGIRRGRSGYLTKESRRILRIDLRVSEL